MYGFHSCLALQTKQSGSPCFQPGTLVLHRHKPVKSIHLSLRILSKFSWDRCCARSLKGWYQVTSNSQLCNDTCNYHCCSVLDIYIYAYTYQQFIFFDQHLTALVSESRTLAFQVIVGGSCAEVFWRGILRINLSSNAQAGFEENKIQHKGFSSRKYSQNTFSHKSQGHRLNYHRVIVYMWALDMIYTAS